MAIIGIDLGTKNSLICTYKNEETILIPNQFGSFLTPTIVHVTEEGYILTGKSAEEKLILDPKNTVSNFKEYLGTDKEFILRNKSYKAYELYGFILNQLKNDVKIFMNEVVTRATVSVPVYFDERKRNDIKRAASLAGINVDYLINDPSAAALSFIDSEISLNKFLVLDFGGTFNATIIDFYRDLIEIISHSHDITISGDAIDAVVSDYFFNQIEVDKDDLDDNTLVLLQKQIELVKKYIDYTVTIDEGSVIFDQDILEEICKPIFTKIKAVISKAITLAGMSPNSIKHVVLVGGASKFSLFYEYIQNLFHKEPVVFKDPQTFVINGVTLHYALNIEKILNVRLTDLCPYSLGISTKNANGKHDITSVVISKNMPSPVIRTTRFITENAFQEKVIFNICKGENYYSKDNEIIDTIEVELPITGDKRYVDITLFYDVDGVLEVEAKTLLGQTMKRVIINEHLVATPEELDKKIKALEDLKESDFNNRIESLLKRVDILYAESDLGKKAEIKDIYVTLEKMLNCTRINQISRSITDIEERVSFWEQHTLTHENDIFAIDEDLFLPNILFDEFFLDDDDDDDDDFINFDIIDDIDDIDDLDFF